MPKLTLCLPPARRRHKAPDSECNGNIASFGRISSNLIKTLLFMYWFNRHLTPTMPKSTLCLPPAPWGPRALDSRCSGNIASFRWISFNFIKKTWLSVQMLPSSDPSNAKMNPLSPTCSLGTQGLQFPVWWQYCLISMIFLLFRQNSTNYTDLAVIQPVQWWFWPFVSHLLAEDPRLSISSVVSILPDFDEFFPTSSKLDHLYRFSRHPMVVLTFCLTPVHWGPWAFDS